MPAPSQDSLEDAGDRAQKRRKMGQMRISLDRIGFWDANRGGLGLSSDHVHEMAWDCLANKTKIERYGHFVRGVSQAVFSILFCNITDLSRIVSPDNVVGGRHPLRQIFLHVYCKWLISAFFNTQIQL